MGKTTGRKENKRKEKKNGKMNKKEKEAIGMLKKGMSIATVARETGFSSFWLAMKMNEVGI